ncbi:GAF domain-containing protein [bacterium]|nr:MAG: GAF domain-containing protein [bacterium]
MAGRNEAEYLGFLVQAGEILGRSFDYHETLRNVCVAAVETVADVCLLDLGKPGNLELVAFAHRDPRFSEDLRSAEAFQAQDGSHHPVLDVIKTGKPVLVSDVDESYIQSHVSNEQRATFMRRMAYRSMIIVPVVSRLQGILGALTLVRTASSRKRYDERALMFAGDLGVRCGVAISKAQLYSQTIELALRLQRAALPRALPVIPGMSLDAYYEPASREIMVGGDWYDAFNLPDGRVGISIGDVAGHGVEAATFMGQLRDALRTALYGDPNVVRALAIADYLVTEEFPDGRYATAMLSILDPQRLTLLSAAAGHPGPLVWDPQEKAVSNPFQEHGLPLGLRRLGESPYVMREITLKRGSAVVFFTDGLVEWQRDYLRGERSLAEALARRELREAANPAIAIRYEIVRGAHQDDIAVLTLRVDGE